MSGYHADRARAGLRAVLDRLHADHDHFRKHPLTAAGLFLERPAWVEPTATYDPPLVAQLLQVPVEHVRPVAGVEHAPGRDSTHNGPFFVALPASAGGQVEDPQREISRQLDALNRTLAPVFGLLRQLPDDLRGLLPHEPNGWWAVLFHLAIHHPGPYMSATRERWMNVTAPRADARPTLRPNFPYAHRAAELTLQVWGLDSLFEDFARGVWSRLAGDVFTASAAAVGWLLEQLDRPAPPEPDRAPVRERFAELHARFTDLADWYRRMPHPAAGAQMPAHLRWGAECALVKVANSFHTPPASGWCEFPVELAFERLLLAQHHADAEYLFHRHMPEEFAPLCEAAGIALPRSIRDSPVMFRRELSPNYYRRVGGRAALNPDPSARWVRFVFNVLRELDPATGAVEVCFLDPPPGMPNPSVDLYGYATFPDGFFAASARAIELAGLFPGPVTTPPAEAQGPAADPSPREADTPAVEVPTNLVPEVLRGVPPPDPAPTGSPPAGALAPRCGGRLLCSPDCGVVVRGVEEFTLTPNARVVIAYMIAAWEQRPREFTRRELLDACDSTAERLRDVFRSNGEMSSAWDRLIVSVEGKRGFYSLRTE